MNLIDGFQILIDTQIFNTYTKIKLASHRNKNAGNEPNALWM